MEFLWADIALAGADFAADGDNVTFTVSTGAPPSAQGNLSDGQTLMFFQEILDSVAVDRDRWPTRLQLQDINGYGQLVATDRVNINASSSGMAAAITWNWRIYYRYVTVGAEEYIGIVQSQTMG